MTLNANALCTLAEAKDHLSIESGDTSQDARVERYINTASQLIEGHCDRNLVFTEYDIRRDGRRSDRLLLPEWPVVRVVKVWDDPSWEFSAQTEIPPDEWTVGEDDDCIVLRGRRFSRGNANIRVQFEAGYRSPVHVSSGRPLPSAINYACLLMVEFLAQVRNDRRLGVVSKGKQGESISFTREGMPPEVERLLADFVRVEVPLSDALTGNA